MSTNLGATVVWGIQWNKDFVEDFFYSRPEAERSFGPDLDSGRVQFRQTGYSPTEQKLSVRLKGGKTYVSNNVPKHVAEEFHNSRDSENYYLEKIRNHYPTDVLMPDMDHWDDWFPDLVESEGLDATLYSDQNFADSYIGCIVGRKWGTFWSSTPEEFDPKSLKVKKEDLQLLRSFCRKYDFPWEKPRWFVRVFGSA